jgi:L-alanine-DL-glutamate epimerase-like enolase superfamily enzyme
MTSNLKITNVERIVVHVPFTPRCHIWNAPLVWQWGVSEIIRITTNAPDVVGYGETLLHYSWGRVSDEAIARVKGGNPADFLGDDTLGPGLQMALYDTVGKALGVPAYRLFNLSRVREWCPIAWWNTEMAPEALAEEAKEAVAAGYISHKFKARPWLDVYEQVEQISAVVPSYYRLDLDWNNMLLNAGNATSVLTELDKYERVAIYESPIMQRDFEGQRLLRSKIIHPIALHFGDPPFPTAVREEVCDGFVVGGGVNSVLKQGILAAAFEKPFWLQLVGTGLTTALAAHLGAVLAFAQWPAVTCLNNYADDLIVDPIAVKGGYMRVPEAPGLGITIDEDALERYRMQPPYSIPKDKHILTVSWPGGRVTHYAHCNEQLWPDCHAGNQPVQEPGVKFEIRNDDGSREWADLYARLQSGPVREYA